MTKYKSHRIKKVVAEDNFKLVCYFENGKIKMVDFNIIKNDLKPFKNMDEKLFKKAKVVLNGLAVEFNDKLDISEETLYNLGNEI